jgi:hypothetical protein
MRRSYSCQIPQAIYPWMSTDLCGSAFASAGIYTMKSLNGNEVVETTVSMRATRDAANAYSIQVRWQSTDLAELNAAQPGGSLASASGICIRPVHSPITIVIALALTFCNSAKFWDFFGDQHLSSDQQPSKS